ncbi:gamma-tubulin complex component 3-like isoform X2 [Drosophila innubila]|uniref:gamma-tubulin complex component 3-like isoform X2 n=1 Tax=Drosophila innubila TaxID=198719 RepID=UPI00148C51F8|nr:gamma-tubulin complex component 3-like isoform X2 [Drosophila innubila]
MSQNIKISSANNNSRPNSELKSLLTNFSEVINGKEALNDLDAFVSNAVQYVSMDPTVFDSLLPRSENDCVQKIMSLLNSRSNLQDGLLPGEIFQERYNDSTEGINDPRLRDLLANLLLSSLQDDPQYHINEMTLLPFHHRKLAIKSNSISSQNGNGINGLKSLARCSYDPTQRSIGLGHQPMPNYMLELSKQKNVDIVHDIVQNAIYSFMGAQGKYLKKDVITGRFKLDPQNMKSLTVEQAGMLFRLSELGYYHDQVTTFSNISTGYNAMGCMGQAFIAKLKLELNDFHGQVAELHDMLNKYRQSQSQDYANREQSWMNRQRKPMTLLKLLTWYIEPLHRMQWLTKVANACQLKKGGELASVIYGFLNNGDPTVDKLASDMLTVCCTPLVRMISKWMLEGNINDSYGEFFIESLPEVGADRLWHDKFRLRLNMLPKFISLELADKILKTGKSINFLREICKIDEAVKGREELKDIIDNRVSQIFSFVPDTSWHAAIETCYSQTSKHVLDIMVGPHKLLVHLQGMRRYLLLGQGDFVSIFIENIKDELGKLGTDLYSHDLSSMLDAALRSTNAQYDDPEILNHLDVVVKTPFAGDCGWDVISLQYTVRGPLATMLEPAMPTYKTLFKPLWRMKHMEFVLSTKIWKEQMGNAKALRALNGEIGKVTYRLHLFTAEIMHFVHQMQYYVLFEVIECSWVELQKRMQQATALDDILDAHSKFLHAISIGCFVKSSKNVEIHLEVVYDSIISLVNTQSQFYDDCFQELAARQQMAQTIADSERSGSFGLTTVQKMERDQERKIFEQKVLTFCRNLEDYANAYGKAVGGFLLALNSSSDPNLQLFGTRLDFNEYYKKRDTNLSKPLTFEHMRMSNVMGNSKGLTAGRYSMNPHPTTAQFGHMALD